MSNLIRRTYTKVDPETGEKITRQTRKWYGQYRDTDGSVKRVPLCIDKTAAQAMLTDIIRNVERYQAGLIDTATDQLVRPISEHIQEYRTHLLAKARSKKHISETVRLIQNVAAECRCRLLADLQSGSDQLEKYIAERLKDGAAFRTINADLVAVRSFCRWLLGKGKMRNDPTQGMHRLNVEEDRRLERRALTDQEAQRLIETTFQSTRRFKKMCGRDRAVLYILAQRTGLRRSELRSLSPASFDLESIPPTVEVKAGSSKRRKRDILPLPVDVAKTMREYLANRPPDQPVWPGGWWWRSAEMLRGDLEEAKIETKDAEGRIVDFHGQRTTFITALACAGVSPATAQKLARHSDINLTMGTYTKLPMSELADAVEKLADFRSGGIKDQPTIHKFTDVDSVQSDPALEEIVTAWPRLSVETRRAIWELIQVAHIDPKAS